VQHYQIQGTHAGDLTGYSLSLSGDGQRLAVGSIGYDGPPQRNSTNIGLVTVYQQQLIVTPSLNQTTTMSWIPIAHFTGPSNHSSFGASVSLSYDGSILAIGAPHHNAHSIPSSGAVFIYKDVALATTSSSSPTMRNHTNTTTANMNNTTQQQHNWISMTYNYNDTHVSGKNNAEDLFGWSVSLSHDGRTLIVGAPKDGSLIEEYGYARVYQCIVPMHTSAAAVVNDGVIDNGTESMYDVTDSGGNNYTNETVLLNSTYNTTDADDNATDGNALMFNSPNNHTMDNDLLNTTTRNNNTNHDHGTWIPISNTFSRNIPGDQFGYSVSISGDGKIISIGSYSSNDFTGLVATYHQQHQPIPSSSQTATSTLNDSFNQSSVSTSWARLGPDLHGTSQGDSFGFSVALSHDGSRMAIGAPFHSNDHPEGEGELANVTTTTGQVQVYELQPPPQQELDTLSSSFSLLYSWIPSKPITSLEQERIGHSVVLSNNGSIVGTAASGDTLIRIYQ